MEQYLLEWLSMLLRLLHVITAIAWIGASFYFVWLDNHLQKPTAPDLLQKKVDGELWAVHGGGFYNPQKYMVAPPNLPQDLHWFYWESYSTWLSGFSLFVLLYLTQARAYLIDPQVYPLSPTAAVLGALAFLGAGWLVYDLLCRLFGFRNVPLGIAVALYVALATLLACHIFSGKGAFLIIGAMMATIMTANVFFWIIPGQKKVIASMRAGEAVDPTHGQRGKQRSVHNTYFTLPVLLCMLSNHFGLLYSNAQRAWVLILLMIAAVLIREFFLRRHKGKTDWQFPLAALGIIIAVALWIQPAPRANASDSPKVTSETAYGIIRQRCYGCHAEQPTLIGGGAPKGVMFENIAQMEQHAEGIYKQTVELKIMPLGNITQMTEEERDLIAKWYLHSR